MLSYIYVYIYITSFYPNNSFMFPFKIKLLKQKVWQESNSLKLVVRPSVRQSHFWAQRVLALRRSQKEAPRRGAELSINSYNSSGKSRRVASYIIYIKRAQRNQSNGQNQSSFELLVKVLEDFFFQCNSRSFLSHDFKNLVKFIQQSNSFSSQIFNKKITIFEPKLR